MSPAVRRWAPWAALVGLVLVFLIWGLNHLGGLYWDTDEGLNLMKARLLGLGYPLYTEIWADQPPGLTALLAGAFALLGPSVAVARGVVLLHAAVCLLAVAWIAREGGAGWLGRLTAVALLILAPNFFWASRAVMIGLPALSLATLAMAMVLAFTRDGRRVWPLLSGFTLGLSLLEKLIGAYLVVPFALAVLLAWRQHAGSWRAALPEAARDLVRLGAAAAAPLLVALLLFDAPAMIDQVVGVVASARAAYTPDLAWNIEQLGDYLLGDHLLLVAPAVFGAVWLLRERSVAGAVILTWLVVTVAALVTQTPLWPKHHFLALLVILAPLAGIGIDATWRGLAGWREQGGADRAWAGLGALALLLAVAGLPAALRADAKRVEALPYKASGKLPSHSQAYLRTDEAVQLVRDHTADGDVIVTDHGFVAFQSGRTVPPELAVVSGKRLAVGALTADDIIAATMRHQPAAILLWDGDRLSRIPEYADWVRENYRLAEALGDDYQLYVPDGTE